MGEGLKKTGVQLVAEGAARFLSDLTQGNKALESFGQAAGTAAGHINVLGEVATGALRYIGELAVKGIGALGNKLADFARDAMAAEVGLARLGAVIESMGGAAGVTVGDAQQLAEQFKDLAQGSDEAVLAIEEIGIRAGSISASEMPAFIQTTLDLSVVMGSTEAAATLLARANEDVVGAMGRAQRSGILFSDSLKQQIKALADAGNTAEATRLFMERVAEATGGLAAAAADTLDGKLKILSNHLADVGKNAVSQFLPALETIVDSVGPALEGAANDAATWGSNIVIQLANGIYAAAQAVIDALGYIGNLITFWLAPGSPPNLLPDLDQWGAAAMTEFARGFSAADFSVLDDVAGAIETSLRSLPTGIIAKDGLIPSILGERSAVAQAIDEMRQFGAVSEQSLQRIFTAAGQVTPEMQAFVRTSFELQAANDAVAAAQADLNRVTKEYDDLLAAAGQQVTELDNAQQDLAGEQRKSQLQLVLNDPNATLAEKEMARLEIEKIGAKKRQRDLEAEKKAAVDAAQTKVDVELERQKALQDQYAAQKALIDLQDQQNKLLAEQVNILKQLAGAGGGGGGGGAPKGGGGGIKPIGPGGGAGAGVSNPLDQAAENMRAAVQGAIDGIETKLAGLQAIWDGAWAAMTARLQPAAEAFDVVKVGFASLVTALADSSQRAQQYVADMVVFVTNELGINLPVVFTNVGLALEQLAVFWRNNGDTIMATVNFVFRVIVATVTGAMTLVSGIVSIALLALNSALDSWRLIFSGNWQGAWDKSRETVETIVAVIQRTLTAFFNAALAIAGTNWAEFTAMWQGVFDNLVVIVTTIFNRVVTAVSQGILDAIAAAQAVVQGFADIGKAIINGIIAGLDAASGGLFSKIGNIIQSALGSARDTADAHSPSRLFARQVGVPIGQGVELGIQQMRADVADAMSALITPPASAQQQAMSYSYSRTYAPQFNYAPTYGGAPTPVTENFAILQALAGS